MSLRNYTDEELRAELARRGRPVCRCGPARREYSDDGDETFHPRTGCLTCDRWDGPPVLRRT